jgi:hypothetical protein
VQSRVGPDADTPVIIPDSLVAVQAFVMWEQAGKPQVSLRNQLGLESWCIVDMRGLDQTSWFEYWCIVDTGALGLTLASSV